MWFRTLFDSMKLRRSGTPVRRTPRRPTATRLRVEALEDRCVPALYAVTDLGTLSVSDLNNAGQVVGQAGTTDGFNHAFLWENGTMIDLGTLGGTYSCANGINDLGQVVGMATLPGGAAWHAFLVTPQGGVWFQDSNLDGRNDLMIDLGTLNGSSYATDINNAGQVVGSSNGYAFLWDAVNGMTDLGVPSGFTGLTDALGINETGQVTGIAEYYDPLSGGNLYSAFLWDAANGMTALGAGPTYTDSQASGINDVGQVVGNQWNASAQIDPAFLWTPDSPNGLTGSFTDLGMLPGAIDSYAAAINNAGQVVGSSTIVESVYVDDPYCWQFWDNCVLDITNYYYPHAFLWDAAGGMVDLQNHLLPGSDATLQYAQAINDGGAIAVSGYNGSGATRAYLLTPIADVPQASSFVVSGFPAPTTAGTAGNFTITAKNADGATASGYTGTVHFTSSDAQAGLPADYTFTTADQGVHTFSAILKTAGTQSLTATDLTRPSVNGTQAGITVNPAAASRFTVTGFPSPVTAGVAGSFTVTARDPYGNRASGYTGAVRFSSSDAQAALPGNYTFTADDAGLHTFSATLKTAGTQSLTATDTASAAITGAQGSILVNPAAASRLVLSAPTSVKANAPFKLTVTVVDAYGNVVTGYRGTLAFSSSDATANLPKSYTFTASDQGVHTFTNLRLKRKGMQTITVTDTLDLSLTSSAIIDVV